MLHGIGSAKHGARDSQTFQQTCLILGFCRCQPRSGVLEEVLNSPRERPLVDERKQLLAARFERLGVLTLRLLDAPAPLLFLPLAMPLLSLSLRLLDETDDNGRSPRREPEQR